MVRVGRRREGGDGGKEGQDKGKSRGETGGESIRMAGGRQHCLHYINLHW